MKKFFLILCLAAFAGCREYIKDDYQGNTGSADYDGVDEVAMLQSGKIVRAMIGIEDPATLTLDAFKNGGYGDECTVTFSVDEGLLSAYNAAEGTSLQILPSDDYTMGETRFQLGAGQTRAALDISYDPADILDRYDGAFGVETYAIPVKMTVSGSAGQDEAKSSAIIVFRIQEPVIGIEQKSFSPLTVIKGDTGSQEYGFGARMNFAGVTDKDLVFESDRDALAAAVAAYNEANETDYKLLPASVYSYTSSKIPAGSDSGTILLAIDKSAIDFSGRYLLPVILTDNGGEIIIEGNATLYLPVTAMELLDRGDWVLDTSSSNAVNPASLAVDGNATSYWHVIFKNAGVIADTDRLFQIGLPETTTVCRVELIPNLNGNFNQTGKYNVYTSMEGSGTDKLTEHTAPATYQLIGAPSTWGGDWSLTTSYSPGTAETPVVIDFAEPVETKYVRLKLDNRGAADNTIGINEINLYGWVD